MPCIAYYYTYVVYSAVLLYVYVGEGRRTRLALWDDPADDITGVIARSEKVASTFEKVS